MATHKTQSQILDMLDQLAGEAKKHGVTDFYFNHGASTQRSVSVRKGEIEKVEKSAPNSLSLSVYFGDKRGSAGTNSLHPDDVKRTLDDAIALARITSPDPTQALTDAADIVRAFPDLQLNDPYDPDDKRLTELALAVESAAFANPKITNSDGAAASHSRGFSTYLASNGFRAQSVESSSGFYATVMSGKDDTQQSDYAASGATWHEDLKSPEEIGQLAAERAVSRLHPVRMQTGNLPVVFDPRVAGSLVNAFLSAIGGNSVYRKSTFLLDKMGQRIFPQGVDLIDDPLIIRGAASGNFDDEGIARRKIVFIQDGILQSWKMGVQSARKLGLKSTGHASGHGNLLLSPGTLTPAELIADIKEGLYVTGFDGGTSSAMTGEYSYVAKGFLISNGLITPQAVSRATIAGHLSDMFRDMTLANNVDLAKFRNEQMVTPTVRIRTMRIGGE